MNDLDLAHQKMLADEVKLRNVTQAVGEFLENQGYLAIKFVKHPEQKHVGVEIVPMPEHLKPVKLEVVKSIPRTKI
jgi:hypothetical protein